VQVSAAMYKILLLVQAAQNPGGPSQALFANRKVHFSLRLASLKSRLLFRCAFTATSLILRPKKIVLIVQAAQNPGGASQALFANRKVHFFRPLKGQTREIFDPRYFSSINPPGVTI
jgi:hypothetical protein